MGKKTNWNAFQITWTELRNAQSVNDEGLVIQKEPNRWQLQSEIRNVIRKVNFTEADYQGPIVNTAWQPHKSAENTKR